MFADDSYAWSTQAQAGWQSDPDDPETELWGYLMPLTRDKVVHRVNFLKVRPRYKIGRDTGRSNAVLLPGAKISEYISSLLLSLLLSHSA